MARVTVDDCMHTIPNRFQMTLAATYRARQITAGASPMVEDERDKPTVIALRELAHLNIADSAVRRELPPAAHAFCLLKQHREYFLVPLAGFHNNTNLLQDLREWFC